MSLLGWCGSAAAQTSGPIRVIVPSASGGVPDVTTRLLTQEMSRDTGEVFVIDNKPGASGLIGMSEFARQPPDGRTLGYVNNVTMSINRSLFKELPYDASALVPVTLLTKGINVIVVSPRLEVDSLEALIQHAREQPGDIAYGSPGQGTSGHLAGELLAMKTGVEMRHIPYRGSPQALNDLLGGQFDMMIDNLPNVLPYIEQGRLRALAVTSANRHELLPDVPTVAESGYPGFEAVAWGGIAMPPGTPEEKARQLNAAVLRALQTAEVQRYLRDTGSEVVASEDPQELSRYAESETAKWAEVVRQAGLQPQ